MLPLADPTGTVRAESHDVCCGRIRFEPAGTNGFGYDPLFEVVEYHRTFGELGPHVKQAISHRSRALRAILPRLLSWLKNRPSTEATEQMEIICGGRSLPLCIGQRNCSRIFGCRSARGTYGAKL